MKLLGVVLLVLLASCAATIFFWSVLWILACLALLLTAFGLAWVFGFPIKVTQNGEIIGHAKRTKFYPKRTKFYPLWSKH